MPTPKLIIRAGELKTMPAQTHLFSEISIENGGNLRILGNSSQWCILHCTGDVTINGIIEFIRFKSGNNSYATTSPDGTALAHTYNQNNKGGDGGKGGNSRCNFNILGGGEGASGTHEYGGGGGAGGIFFEPYSNCKNQKGNDANKDKGGLSINKEGKGGDGWKRDPYSNGGLLFIFCGNNFDGTNGSIVLTGLDGEDGKDGSKNRHQVRGDRYDGCGGGGGGQPGGLGGVCIIRVGGTILNYPTINVKGGYGGDGGKGARGGYQEIASAEDGTNGEDGENGYVKYINN
ncbi:MAG: hypothetical protein JNK27_12845 [Chitinophagaceae bacterium]|nr:hypothetical protein [Chitinophagaceae bacterium]